MIKNRPVISAKRLRNVDFQRQSPTLMLVILLAAVGALLYSTFIWNPDNRGDWLPYTMVLIAEGFIIFQAALALWTILAGSSNPRNFEFHDAQEHLFTKDEHRIRYETAMTSERIDISKLQMFIHRKPVSVDVFITTFGEPIEVIRRTAVACRDLSGLHNTYLLDDGKSDEVKNLAELLNIGYIRRPTNEGAKAGNINYALQHTNGDFFAIFDADFVPAHNFLYETLPFFEDKQTAFVQTPQYYRNSINVVSKGAAFMQLMFYKLIMAGKNNFNAAFCVGTNVVFRRSAVETIGGIYDKSKSEDIWTALLLHEKKFRSVYIPDVLAIGDTPDTIKAFSKQQLRWATGGFEIFFWHNPLFRPLTIDQKIQYLGTVTYYFHGFAAMLLFLLPPLHIFFNLSPVNTTTGFIAWAFAYLAFYGMQIIVAFYTMGGFKLQVLLLAMVSFPIYVRAMLNGLLRRDVGWQATGNKAAIDSPYNYIVPQILIFIFLLFTSAVGIWKAYYTETIALSLLWALLNTIVFGSFIRTARREHRQLKRALKQERKERRYAQRRAQEAAV